MYLGQVLFERGQPAEAEKAFRASLSVDPTFAAPHFYLGQLYESQDRKRDALREYREAVARQSDLSEAATAVKRLESQVAADVPTGNARTNR
jgi:predicted Zn-dependent protease